MTVLIGVPIALEWRPVAEWRDLAQILRRSG